MTAGERFYFIHRFDISYHWLLDFLKISHNEDLKLFMLNSTEHEFYHAHKCWHFNIDKHEKYNICQFESMKRLHFSEFKFL